MGKRLTNFKTGKTYKKRIKGKSHKILIEWYGMQAIDERGFIKMSYLNEGIKRAKREYQRNPTEHNLTIQKRLVQAKNWKRWAKEH